MAKQSAVDIDGEVIEALGNGQYVCAWKAAM